MARLFSCSTALAADPRNRLSEGTKGLISPQNGTFARALSWCGIESRTHLPAAVRLWEVQWQCCTAPWLDLDLRRAFDTLAGGLLVQQQNARASACKVYEAGAAAAQREVAKRNDGRSASPCSFGASAARPCIGAAPPFSPAALPDQDAAKRQLCHSETRFRTVCVTPEPWPLRSTAVTAAVAAHTRLARASCYSLHHLGHRTARRSHGDATTAAVEAQVLAGTASQRASAFLVK